MAKSVPATTKNSPAVKVGKGKTNGPGAEYAPPHTMSGERISPKSDSYVTEDPNTLTSKQLNRNQGTLRVSMGDPGADDVKTEGIMTRGNGAAERGRTARGPMA
jgi:hypothetical protein